MHLINQKRNSYRTILKIPTMAYLIETDIASKIRTSEAIGSEEKNHFLHLLSYFTPGELDELRLLL